MSRRGRLLLLASLLASDALGVMAAAVAAYLMLFQAGALAADVAAGGALSKTLVPIAAAILPACRSNEDLPNRGRWSRSPPKVSAASGSKGSAPSTGA